MPLSSKRSNAKLLSASGGECQLQGASNPDPLTRGSALDPAGYLSVNSSELFFGLFRARVKVRVRIRVRVRVGFRLGLIK